jgi:hypothetical protein
MSAPTEDVSWATDDNYPAGPAVWNGTPTKTEPSSGRKAEGWEPNQKPPAQEMNWWMWAVYTWIVYIADFIANIFTTAHEWTDTQTFDVPPVAPDYYLSANKTRHFGVAMAHRNGSADTFDPDVFEGPEPVYDGTTGALVKYTFFNNTKPVCWDLALEDGDQITGYGARVQKTSNVGQTMYCKLVAIDNATGAVTDGDSANASASNSTNNPGYFLLSPPLAPVVPVVDGSKRYQLLVYTSGAFDAEDSVLEVEIDWTHPAP